MVPTTRPTSISQQDIHHTNSTRRTQSMDLEAREISVNYSNNNIHVPELREDSHSGTIITDIIIANRKEVPFGYSPILSTVGNYTINSENVICVSRSGRAALKQMALVRPSKGDTVPEGFSVLRNNLNEALDKEEEATYLCFAKGKL